MQDFEVCTVLLFGGLSLFGLLKGSYEVKSKNNSYGFIPLLNIIGAFVWGDAVVFGAFWLGISIATFVLKDFMFFLFTFSVFWLVRSFGETIYWFNQQFSQINGNPVEQYWIYKFLRNDSVWFIHQIFWQVITVLSVISSVYFGVLWISKII